MILIGADIIEEAEKAAHLSDRGLLILVIIILLLLLFISLR